MPIHNEIFESYRQQVKELDKAMRLLVFHGYKIIDCLVILMFCFSLGGLLGEIAKLARYRTSI